MPFSPKHILVAVDLDLSADHVLAAFLVDAAADLAHSEGAVMTLLYVLPHVALPPLVPLELHTWTTASTAARAEVENRLSRLAASLRKRGLDVNTVLVDEDSGGIPTAIVDEAQRRRADLIAIATHRRRGLKRLLLGSVAARVARLAQCAVLLLPPV